MRAFERFLKYVKFSTASSEETGSAPSTSGQIVLADALKQELEELGIKAYRDEYGYVYAKIEAESGYENADAVGFIAHMDTSPECSGEGVLPKVTENYDGKDIELGGGLILKPSSFPDLYDLKGKTLITASGDTLLGADDKAGVAEIMTLCERLVGGEIPHGTVCIAFTPDEEIGEGADRFDVKRFGAKYGYTVDGGKEGGVEYENFNASSCEVNIKGLSVHPGDSKNTMINASLVAMEYNAMLPSSDIPRNTEGYEGFYHLTSMRGDVSSAELKYIIRDHDPVIFEKRGKTACHIAELLNEKYGEGTVSVTVKEQYRNMAEMVKPHQHIVDIAIEATKEAGVTPYISAIRGGTDGARLSFMGLPCPNLGTGGYAYHGPYEHITAEAMDSVTEILTGIVKRFALKQN